MTDKPKALPVHLRAIPAQLKTWDRWLMWRYALRKGKWTKPPYQTDGRLANSTKPATWTTFKEAIKTYLLEDFDGIGAALTKELGLVGIDIDNCRDLETGELSELAQVIVAKFNSYTEVSPSGKGLRIFVKGEMPEKFRKQNGDIDLEVYNDKRYLTVTGHKLPDVPASIEMRQDELDWLLGSFLENDTDTDDSVFDGDEEREELAREALKHLAPSRADGYWDWLTVGMALRSVSPDLLLDWDEWSSQSGKYAEGACEDKWRSFSCKGVSIGSLLYWAQKDTGWRPPPRANSGQGLIKTLADRICADDHFAQDAGGKLYRFADGVYKARGDQYVKSQVKVLCVELKRTKGWTPKLANDVVEYVRVDSPTLWEQPPLGTINTKNGLLRVRDRVLLPHSPTHLSPVQLPVKYDPGATCPAIEQFVDGVFPGDATMLAWEIAAWLMRPTTSIQKAVLLIGPGGNGKSVFLRLLVAFLGKSNVSGLALHRLESDEFAVARLLGKLANICSDLPSEHLQGTSVFKSITGGDPITGEFKFRDSFDFVPFTRLVFSANYPPRSKDSSQGFFDRWLVIPFDQSFRGTDKEVPGKVLDDRLQAPSELSGLLNKALDALKRIDGTCSFSTPESVQKAWTDFHGTTDPLAVWLDLYAIDDPAAFVVKQDLRAAFNTHLEHEGRPTMSERMFALAFKKLRGNVTEVQRTIGGERQRCYAGIGMLHQD